VNKLLVVCPISVFDAWLNDEIIETFLDRPTSQVVSTEIIKNSASVLVVNYEKLENQNILSKLKDWLKENNVLMVLDEAHRVKGGSRSTRWRGCKELAELSYRVELLTGTPMPQSYEDLKNLFSLSWNNLPNSMLTDGQLSSLRPGGVFVRTTKAELNLPPPTIEEIPLDLSPVQNDIYDALKRQYNGLFKIKTESRSILSKKGIAVMSLIAAASNPGLLVARENESAFMNFSWPPKAVTSNSELMDIINHYAMTEMPSKYKWLYEFIKKSSKKNKKTIVWTNFVGNLKSLNRILKIFDPALVYGGVSGDDRKEQISKFRNDENCHVLITNPQTLGEGISLHRECNQAVYIDRTFNAVHYLQSLDRIHRLGLSKDTITNIFVLTSNNTIDNRIDSRLKTKINRMSKSLNDKSLVSSSFVQYDEDNELIDLYLDEEDEVELLKYITDE
jgi:hypothetical protein